MSTFSAEELLRYSRQMALPQIGRAGQERLRAARVLVIGAGGLGCPALQYLAAAGVGTLGIVDDDIVELSNLHRQVLFTEDELGQSKAETAARRLRAMNPNLAVFSERARFAVENAEALVSEFELVLDCSDNFATRYLVNDACVKAEHPFIGASVLGFEGQLGCFNVLQEGRRSGTYRCIFPEPPSAELAPDCMENGVLGVVPGIMGALQAGEALKILLGLGAPLIDQLLLFNGLSLNVRVLEYVRNEESAGAIARAPLRAACADACDNFCDNSMVKEITVHELKAMMDRGDDFQLIDIREAFEKGIADIGGELIPPSTLQSAASRISKDKPAVLYCRSGIRSRHACEALQKMGYNNVQNLRGGILAWSTEIDSSIRKY